MDFIVEYAVLIDFKESLCGSKDAFINFLGANSKFQVNAQDRCIKFSDESGVISLIYDVSDEEVQNKQKLFIVKFKFNESEKDDSNFECIYRFLREFRKLIQNLKLTNIYILQDDLGSYYAKKAYPEINRIENLLRKLILRFFLQNIGNGWENKIYKIDEIKKEIDISKEKEKNALNPYEEGSILHEMDFIHLSFLLTTPWRSLSRESVDRLIEKWEESELKKLKGYLPRSNWDRYFAEVINYEESKFKEQWKRLYDLRCLVAHSRSITFKEYEEITNLISELEEKIQKALDKIEDIIIPEEEKKDVAQNASVAVSLELALNPALKSSSRVQQLMQEIVNQINASDLNQFPYVISKAINASQLNVELNHIFQSYLKAIDGNRTTKKNNDMYLVQESDYLIDKQQSTVNEEDPKENLEDDS